MKSQFKQIFKLTNWKRWFILAFTFIFGGLFIGLSFGLKSNQIKISNNYSNGLQVITIPKWSNGSEIEQSLINQLIYNLQNRLESNYPENDINIQNNDNSFDIKITNINSDSEKDDFLSNLVNKNAIVITALEGKYNNSFYQNSLWSNNVFTNVSNLNESSKTYTLNMNKDTSKSVYNAAKALTNNPSNMILIWKNFELFKQIADNDPEFSSSKYDNNYYSYLYVDGFTPEKKANASNTSQPSLLKTEIVDFSTNRKYSPYDFLVSKNSLEDYNGTTTLTISKDFGDSTFLINNSLLTKEFYNLEYWISSYEYNDYVSSFYVATQGRNSYTFLIIALVSFFAIVSIFVVINYGYLGIIALLLMAIIVFLSLLFITVFIGNYDTISITIILLSSIISLDFIINLIDKTKREFLKGNSIEKSIRNTLRSERKSSLFRSITLLFVNLIFYIFLSSLFTNFSMIILIISIFIPFILILGFEALIRTIVGINLFSKDSKLIGFWNKKYNSKQSNGTLSTTITKDWRIKEKRSLARFEYINQNGIVLTLSIIIFIVLASLTIFLISFFFNGQSLSAALNTTIYDNNNIVLSISKENNSSLTIQQINEIKNYLFSYGISEKNINVLNLSFIQVILDKDFSQEYINHISQNLISNYGTKVISAQSSSSNIYKLLELEFYAFLLTILFSSLFALFWQGWAKAISLFLINILMGILVVAMIFFGLIPIDSMLCVAIIMITILFTLLNINLSEKISSSIKKIRIEEMTKETITTIVHKSVVSILKPMLKLPLISLITFAIFTIFVGALPISFTLFMMGFVLISLLLSIFILPKLIIIFETKRAKAKRNKILNNYWETEKVKEQTFSGINNVK